MTAKEEAAGRGGGGGGHKQTNPLVGLCIGMYLCVCVCVCVYVYVCMYVCVGWWVGGCGCALYNWVCVCKTICESMLTDTYMHINNIHL